MSRVTQIEVHTFVGDVETLVGMLYAEQDHCSFRYYPAYVAMRDSYDLAPSLPRSSAPFYFNGIGPFSDCAPDRWGRKVMARGLKRTRLCEFEYLLGVNDATRQGATRFYVQGHPMAGNEGVPMLTSLPDLIDAADKIDNDQEIADIALHRLYRATGSLGGARPKASVIDQSVLWMAKFPKSQGDEWDVIGWEAVTLQVARNIGLLVPDYRTLHVEDPQGRTRTVLLTQRFDRVDGGVSRRIPYISAMTALNSHDGDGGDWLDLAEFTRSAGADLHELWKRAVFGAAIGNCDDHLRNHGFLRVKNAWVLAPAFDVNPEPYDSVANDVHQLSLFGNPELTISHFLTDEALDLFDVTRQFADGWLPTLRSGLSQALGIARMHHLDSHSVDLMGPRFDNALRAIP
jgi:serine/threonine-protein kinase HipA